jgi:hypothetical protein
MTESKIELTERLRREGRWAEASKFKDTALKEFRSKGMKRAEAAEEAWQAMANAFPPQPVAECPADSGTKAPGPTPSGAPAATANLTPAEELIDVDALLERVGDRQPPDLVRDTLWVYQHLANRNAKPESAPSLGAWNLLQWARRYKNRFFEQVLPKAMAAKPPEDEENIRREKTRIEEMERVLRELNQQWAEELVANVPETVRAKVRSILEDWARRSAMTIPSEAKADLEAHVGRLVQDCVDVLAPASVDTDRRGKDR